MASEEEGEREEEESTEMEGMEGSQEAGEKQLEDDQHPSVEDEKSNQVNADYCYRP